MDNLRAQINTVQALVESLQREIASHTEVVQGLDSAKVAIQKCNKLRQEIGSRLEKLQALNLVVEVERLLAPFYSSSEAIRLRILAQSKQSEANSHQNALAFLSLSNLGQLVEGAQKSKAELAAFAEKAKLAIRAAGESKKKAQAVIDGYEGLTTVGQIRGRTQALTAMKRTLECYSRIKGNAQDQRPPMQGDQIKQMPVPPLIGLPAKDAREKLIAAGFAAEFQVGIPAPRDKGPFEVYEQAPAAGTRLAHGKAVSATIYAGRSGQGFQPGDGARVDPRFANAKVTDGELKVENMESAGAIRVNSAGAGPKCAIEDYAGIVPGATVKGPPPPETWYWSIKKHSTPAGARQLPSQLSEVWRKTESWNDKRGTGFKRVIRKSVAADNALLELTAYTPANAAIGIAEFRHTVYCHSVIYRDVFLITYGGSLSRVNHDFSAEDARILENSKKLINERFPSSNE